MKVTTIIKISLLLIFCIHFSVASAVTVISQNKHETTTNNTEEIVFDDVDNPDIDDGFTWGDGSYTIRFYGDFKNETQYNELNDASLFNPEDIVNSDVWENKTGGNLKLDADFFDRIELSVISRLRNEHSKNNEKTDNKFTKHLDQAYANFKLGNENLLFVSIGKQRVKWGTGHFWNPVDTFNIQQDLEDVEKNQEGKISYRADFVNDILTLSGIAVPDVDSSGFDVSDFVPQEGNSLYAAKLYKFVASTDFSLYMSKKKSETMRTGASFSLVIFDLQIFGEGIFWNGESEKRYPIKNSDRISGYDPVGNSSFTTPASYTFSKKEDSFYKLLVGFQYTSQNDVTLIGEYYHNSDGYDKNDKDTFVEFLEYMGESYQGDIDSLNAARERNPAVPLSNYPSIEESISSGNSLYRFANFRNNYVHLTIRKPYLYNRFNLSFDTIYCLDDLFEGRKDSFFFRPSVTYVEIPDWQFKIYSQIYSGDKNSEFGMLNNHYSVIFAVKYFF